MHGHEIDATLAVVAVGWLANTDPLDLAVAGVETDPRGYIKVDSQLRTTAPGIYAAGDVTGHLMVVHEAAREGYLAATNATVGSTEVLPAEVSPLGSFTDPEYASVGLTEATARETHDVVVGKEDFDSMPRPIIDGRPTGFCKLVVDRESHTILGCHIVGERAVELAQLAALAVASGHEGRAARSGSLLVPHLRQRARTRSGQSRAPARLSLELGRRGDGMGRRCRRRPR